MPAPLEIELNVSIDPAPFSRESFEVNVLVTYTAFDPTPPTLQADIRLVWVTDEIAHVASNASFAVNRSGKTHLIWSNAELAVGQTGFLANLKCICPGGCTSTLEVVVDPRSSGIPEDSASATGTCPA